MLPNLLERLPLGPTGEVVAPAVQPVVLLALIPAAPALVFRYGLTGAR